MEFFTIGVYNSSEEEYFTKLSNYQIDTFCDIRQRRGVRGSKYSFVNSKRLQNRLDQMSINYLHILDLAPTKEIRELQKEADLSSKEKKRERGQLGKIFTIAFKDRILKNFDFENFIEELKSIGGGRIVLFCVEEKPEACHRSIVSDRLEKLGYKTTHI